MATTATITFAQTGVQPPVYVTSSLSGWTTLEMNVEEDKTASDNLIFSKEFSDVSEGSYQYKIRLGEDHWILDESKDTATDDQGIRNNVLHVKPARETSSASSASGATTVQEPTSDMPSLKASPVLPAKLPEYRKDSTMDQEQLPTVPGPFEVVEKVADQEHLAHGDVQQVQLLVDATKRAADTEPDFEGIKPGISLEAEIPKSPETPLIVVEKTDDKLSYGDDFGKDATSSQKAAHEMRTADASPDKLVITSEAHVEPGSEEEQAAPLFRHESFQADVASTPSMDTIDEESVPSSADHTSTSDAIDTPPEPAETDDGDDDELHQGPLLGHETWLGEKSGELEHGPLLSHEKEEHDADKLDEAPLLSHETGLHDDSGIASEEEEEDELNRFPLMSHESGFSDYKESEIRTNSDFGYDDRITLGAYHDAEDEDEDDYADGDDDDAPLLPHEQDFAVASNAGSDFSQDGAPFSLQDQPTFGYETDTAQELFGGAGRANIFRARTSSLPHKMPQSDAEDENLNDPSLERFPTSRQQILERVATIGLHLPEDDTMHEHPQSPQLSVLSQACSSVDLVPVKSYTSLASVPEAEYSDDEEDQDVESLPSPVYIGQNSRGASGPSNGQSEITRDPLTTPMPDESKQLGFNMNDKKSSNHSKESSETESINKIDGAKDISGVFSALRDVISTPTRVMSPAMAPVYEPKTTAREEHPVSNLDSELRKRRALVEQSSQTEDTDADSASIKDKIVKGVSPGLAQQPGNRNEGFVQHFFRVVFGPVGRFLTACVGDRKRASASAIVLGVAAVGYYYVVVA